MGLWFEDRSAAGCGLEDEACVFGEGDFAAASDPAAIKRGGCAVESDAGSHLG